ncbi:MAG: acyl-CoA dehydrogenase family protein [Acidimicrobiales bacterium]|nr:acyl-CoA dehydrogenase family protein [Acidimicrobiales bacterium]
MSAPTEFAELHDDLRAVARELLAASAGEEIDWGVIADAGWLGLEVPEGQGGAGATFAEVAVILEELGRAATPGPYLGTAVLGVGALAVTEPGPRVDELLAAVAAGEVLLGVALAPTGDRALVEPAFRVDGADAAPTLHGRAEFVADANVADRLLLLADHPDHGMVFVDVSPDAVVVDEQPVIDATRRFGTVAAAGVEVAAGAILPIVGDVQHVADRGALAVACDGIGLAATMLDATVAYVADRQQFGRPIGSFQAVKHTCADMQVQLTVARELVDAAVEAVVTDRTDAPRAVARASSFAGETAVSVVGDALQMHGGIGYTWESGLHVHLKRATLDRSLFGSPSAQRRRLAAALAAGAGTGS